MASRKKQVESSSITDSSYVSHALARQVKNKSSKKVKGSRKVTSVESAFSLSSKYVSESSDSISDSPINNKQRQHAPENSLLNQLPNNYQGPIPDYLQSKLPPPSFNQQPMQPDPSMGFAKPPLPQFSGDMGLPIGSMDAPGPNNMSQLFDEKNAVAGMGMPQDMGMPQLPQLPQMPQTMGMSPQTMGMPPQMGGSKPPLPFLNQQKGGSKPPLPLFKKSSHKNKNNFFF